MSLHLIKLCVGCDSIARLQRWQAGRIQKMAAAGQEPLLKHTTRMTPKRADELLDGGSLYWVIKGSVLVRQRLTDIQSFRDTEGIRRCNLVLDPVLVPTRPQPRRAFQGWRYFEAKDAPEDLASGDAELAEMPEDMRRELLELGLI